MSIHLITGDDPVLVSEAVTSISNELLADMDRNLALEQIGEAQYRNPDESWDLMALVGAALTPPFLTDRRVIVGRHLARFNRPADHSALSNLLAAGLETTDLVLVWERGIDPPMEGRLPTLPTELKKAVQAASGNIVNVTPPRRSGSQTDRWLNERLNGSGLVFDREARASITVLLGEDRSRVTGLLRTLVGALGPGAAVTAADVEALGGDAGAVAPWQLDDAIDRGDISTSLGVLHRILPSRNPYVLLAALHGRYQRMLRLDGAGVRNPEQAGELLGMKGKSTYPAKKLLDQTRRLGSDKIFRAIRHLAEADLHLRGTVDWPDELVIEILVARLASLVTQSAARPGSDPSALT